jgi:hypothetical protein
MPRWFGSGPPAGATRVDRDIADGRSSLPTIPPRPAPVRAMTLRAWRPLRRNSLLGFASVELPFGLII